MSNLEILKNYNYLGEQKLENGTLLIGLAPHIAPKAWLHCIHAPLNNEEISELEKKLKVTIPECYKLFLKKEANGIKVFNTTFYLFGFRKITYVM
jgi:hypothetical protein